MKLSFAQSSFTDSVFQESELDFTFGAESHYSSVRHFDINMVPFARSTYSASPFEGLDCSNGFDTS